MGVIARAGWVFDWLWWWWWWFEDLLVAAKVDAGPAHFNVHAVLRFAHAGLAAETVVVRRFVGGGATGF